MGAIHRHLSRIRGNCDGGFSCDCCRGSGGDGGSESLRDFIIHYIYKAVGTVAIILGLLYLVG